jgi:UDP-N-acetylglucosamine 2-epimerase (non-hydrolysing)
LLPGRYVLVTLHRPANVDSPDMLRDLLGVLERIAAQVPVLFPVHPRTRKMIDAFGIELQRVQLVEPAGYLEFIALEAEARLVLTDSGGIQEETTVLQVPCLTLRTTTERPVTVNAGTNCVVGQDPRRIWEAAQAALAAPTPRRPPPEKWDGQAAERIVAILQDYLAQRRAAPARGAPSA